MIALPVTLLCAAFYLTMMGATAHLVWEKIRNGSYYRNMPESRAKEWWQDGHPGAIIGGVLWPLVIPFMICARIVLFGSRVAGAQRTRQAVTR